MKYLLRAERSGQQVAEAELEDNFAAEQWAREWVRSAAGQDQYLLEGAEGGFARLVVKTNYGQCYFTPAAVGAPAA